MMCADHPNVYAVGYYKVNGVHLYLGLCEDCLKKVRENFPQIMIGDGPK